MAVPRNELVDQETELREGEIDLRQLLRVLRKWAWVIVLITVVAVLSAGVLSYFVLDPVYEAQVTLMVTQALPTTQPGGQPLQGQGLEQVMGVLARLPQMTLNTYVGQLTSESLMQRVLQELQLDRQGYTARSLAGLVQAKNIKDTNLIQVTVSHTDPHLAADIANAVSRQFVDFVSEQNREQMAKSVEFLDKQSREVEEELKAARQKLHDFQVQARGVGVVQQEFDAKSADLARLQSEAVQLGVTIEQLQAGVRGLQDSLAATPRTVVVEEDGKKVERLNDVYVSLSEMLEQKQVELAEKQARLESTRRFIAQLEAELADLQAELVDKQATESELRARVDQLNQTYQTLLQKKTEVQIARSINLGETSILVVSPAYIPSRPVRPNRQLNMAVSGVLGVMVGVMLAFLLEYLDNTVKSAEDVQRVLGAPVIGNVPLFTGADRGR
ncbi:MAG: Wzz/FepE/Etk N-terminal domain-containing protein [Bacillota bacterium]|nr:Wzz/FepE/Etk N-terminal domain-containing protein [Bacillota bacterium]MDI7250461.1 Wzz/FepE/Etk N-terminal domain-containing protein [Bacillota bacterium]